MDLELLIYLLQATPSLGKAGEQVLEHVRQNRAKLGKDDVLPMPLYLSVAHAQEEMELLKRLSSSLNTVSKNLRTIDEGLATRLSRTEHLAPQD